MRLKIASVAWMGAMVAMAGAQTVVPVKATTVVSQPVQRRAYLVKLDGQARLPDGCVERLDGLGEWRPAALVCKGEHGKLRRVPVGWRDLSGL